MPLSILEKAFQTFKDLWDLYHVAKNKQFTFLVTDFSFGSASYFAVSSQCLIIFCYILDTMGAMLLKSWHTLFLSEILNFVPADR